MLDSILEALSGSGPVVVPITVVILIGAVMEWWVWGTVYRREVTEKEYWRDKAFELSGLGEKAIGVATAVVSEEPL